MGRGRSEYRAADRETLAELWRRWHRAGSRMPGTLWTASSGLGDWTVRELYAHVSRGVSTLAGLLAQPPSDGEPELSDAAAYFAAVRSLDAVQVARTASAWAAERTTVALVEEFDAVRAFPETTVVRTIAGTMRVADFAVTRIVEATVHLLDLGAVVPHADGPTPEALHRTVDVLADLTPATDFVLAATGRPAPPFLPVLT